MVLARIKVTQVLLLALLTCAVAVVLNIAPAHAHHDNRPPANTPETNARNLCNTGPGAPNVRRGAIWLTASSSYYSVGATVNATATSIPVYIRGSIYNCNSTLTGNVYARDVRPGTGGGSWRLSNLASTTLYRGNTTGPHQWSTQGGTINARLNVSGLATSGPQTITVNLWRCFSSSPTGTPTGTCGQESVQITVTRTAASSCEVRNAPTTIDPGQSFTARFYVYNGGEIPRAETWPINHLTERGRFVLVRNNSSPSWGLPSNGRVIINGSGMNPVLGGILAARTGTLTSTRTYQGPSTPGTYQFSFRIGQIDTQATNIRCSVNITVRNTVPANLAICRPFTGIAGFPGRLSGNILVADENNNPIPGNRVSPGDTVRLGVVFRNTGSATWPAGTSTVPTTYGMIYQKNPGDPDIELSAVPAASMPSGSPFLVDNVNYTTQRVYSRLGTPATPANSERFFYFGITIPDDFEGQSMDLEWRMAQLVAADGRSPERFGDSCTVTLRFPRNRPYLMINGGDVYSGASFRNAECTPTAAARTSHISTNGFSSEGAPSASTWNSGTSMSQYAVLASGVIGDGASPSTNTFLGNYGYLARTRTGSNMNPLRDVLFANQEDDRGSYFADAPEAMPCVGAELTEAEEIIADGGAIEAANGNDIRAFLGDSRDGIMYHRGDVDVRINQIGGTVNVPEGTRKTVVVLDGTLEVIGNIRYPSTYSNPAAVPFVQLIARGGNIYLNHWHTRVLDAHLIAVPSVAEPDERGIIDTCAGDAIGGEWVTPLVAGSCYKQPTPGVIINGSVIARRVLWKHTSGTLGQDGEYIPSIPGLVPSVCSAGVAGGGEDALSLGRYRQCAAELVNFSPEAHLRRFGGDTSNSYSNTPATSQELPPIY